MGTPHHGSGFRGGGSSGFVVLVAKLFEVAAIMAACLSAWLWGVAAHVGIPPSASDRLR
jgi:hypothetical protein